MAIDLSQIPVPLFGSDTRSAIEKVRRMLLIHWSAGKYLDAVSGNYGVKRPPLGFSDDDFFRAAAQALMADYKSIAGAFWQLLEIAAGPYENLTFRVENDIHAGIGYFDISKEIEYITYSAWNLTEFELGETISNGSGTLATIVYHDKEEQKIHYISRQKGDFASGDTVTGVNTGAFVTSSSASLRQQTNYDYPVTDRLPLYGDGIIYSELTGTSEDSGVDTLQLPLSYSEVNDFYNGWTILLTSGAAAGDSRTIIDYDGETRTLKVDSNWSALPDQDSNFQMTATSNITFASVDKYRRRTRVVDNFALSHSAGSAFFIDGGCWELIEAKARRVSIKITCEEKLKNMLPGNAYLHPYPWVKAFLREDASLGSVTLKHDESVLDGVPTPPFNLIVDPEERLAPVESMSVLGYNSTTREFTVPALASRRRIRGTKLKWIQADYVTGGVTTAAAPAVPPAVQELKSYARYENPVGLWILDRGGANEELIFVTGTTYQKRQVTSEITPSSSFVSFDYPLYGIPEGPLASALTFRVSDTTGFLGTITATSVFYYDPLGNSSNWNIQLGLSAAPAFSTDILNKQTYMELVDTAAGEVTWTLSRPLVNNHAIATTIERWYGTDPVIPTDASHLPEAGWPPGVNPEGKWPGPYLFSALRRAPANIRESAGSTVEAKAYVARNDLNDARIYIGVDTLLGKFDANAAGTTLTKQFVTVGTSTFEFQPYNVILHDASKFPTTAQVNAWRSSPSNPRPGYPVQVVVGGEGRFGRQPLYYWGKGAPGTKEEHTIYVSGISKIYLPGVGVASYLLDLPIETAISGALGVDDGFPLTEDVVILDHGDESEEIVFYDSLTLQSPNRATLNFERGFVPVNGHDPVKLSNIDSSIYGAPIVRTDDLGRIQPRVDGYSFPFVINGNILFLRLAFMMELVRAAGIKLSFYDNFDKKIKIDFSDIIQLQS